MKDLPPITKRERWLFERVLPCIWGGGFLLLVFGSFIPLVLTWDYRWLALPVLPCFLLHYSGKKLSQYGFLYIARATKADWKRWNDEARDNYGSFSGDLLMLGTPVLIIVVIPWLYEIFFK